jgi:deazaflavin-dependent oxidoreductase (nitroreductase family)
MRLREHASAVVEIDGERHRNVAAANPRRADDVPAEAAFDHALQGGIHRCERYRRAGIVALMALDGEYEPSSWQWVRDQVETYERTGGREANTLRDTGLPIIIVTTRGNKSGKLRKTPLMRVEHDGAYALVASMGGAPKNPVWYYNLKADADAVVIQDGPQPFDATTRELTGDERAEWWERAVASYPDYADYQKNTERVIPVFVATRRS